MSKQLSPILIEERARLMMEAYKRTHSFQDVADVFNTSRQVVFQIINSRLPEKERSKSADGGSKG